MIRTNRILTKESIFLYENIFRKNDFAQTLPICFYLTESLTRCKKLAKPKHEMP